VKLYGIDADAGPLALDLFPFVFKLGKAIGHRPRFHRPVGNRVDQPPDLAVDVPKLLIDRSLETGGLAVQLAHRAVIFSDILSHEFGVTEVLFNTRQDALLDLLARHALLVLAQARLLHP
jgi:hypothetical protein